MDDVSRTIAVHDGVLLLFRRLLQPRLHRGGSFTIRTFIQKEHKESVEITGEELVVEVEDTGKGIPDELLPKIFDPFFTSKERGTGLGLAVVHRIMTDHGGSIRIKKTEVGKGTCFSLHFPIYSEEPKAESALQRYSRG